MRADRAYTFIFKINVCRSTERFFQSVSTNKRSTAVVFVHFTDFFRDFNPCIGLVKFLMTQFFSENRIQVFRFQRLFCSRVQRRHWLIDHVSLNIVPVVWNFFFRQDIPFSFVTHNIVVF